MIGMNAATRFWKFVVVPVFVALLLSVSLSVAYAEPSTSCSESNDGQWIYVPNEGWWECVYCKDIDEWLWVRLGGD